MIEFRRVSHLSWNEMRHRKKMDFVEISQFDYVIYPKIESKS